MQKITVVALRKGGVGKTTTAQHLGFALADMGRQTLLVDLDPQASLTDLFGGAGGSIADLFDARGNAIPEKLREIVVPTYKKKLFLAPASPELADADIAISQRVQGMFAIDDIFRKQRLPFQHIVIDTAPGRSAFLTAALVAADEIVVPVQLSPMGFQGFGAIDEMVVEAREIQRRTGGVRLRYRAIVPTFYSQGEIVSDTFLQALHRSEHPDYQDELLPLSIPVPETTAFEKASAARMFENGQHAQTIFEMAPNGDSSPTERGQQAYMVLAGMVAND